DGAGFAEDMPPLPYTGDPFRLPPGDCIAFIGLNPRWLGWEDNWAQREYIPYKKLVDGIAILAFSLNKIRDFRDIVPRLSAIDEPRHLPLRCLLDAIKVFVRVLAHLVGAKLAALGLRRVKRCANLHDLDLVDRIANCILGGPKTSRCDLHLDPPRYVRRK